MNHLWFNRLLLLGASAEAFQIPTSIPSRAHTPYLLQNAAIEQLRRPLPTSGSSSSTALHGKLWKRLQIEEDDPVTDGTQWYLINCVAGVELDLLNQCRYVCSEKAFPPTLVEKFVVPTERHLRSHGDKKKVVDIKVRYPGYVFCKICLVEDVYECLQELELARSWMGTVNRKGHKKLPPAPLPLNEEEVKRFKGLEEEQELFEDMYGGDYTGRNDTGFDLLAQYEGYDVGQMVKILKGNFEGEDGTVRRLKGGQLMVRMFTYGQTFDEWFDPDAIRPLTDLEVMRGMSGPTKPIDQDQFDVSIGKKDPSILEEREDGSPGQRAGLLQSAGIGEDRNRRQDRVARGETGRDMFGRSAEEIKKEEENWLAYREEKRGRGGAAGAAAAPPPGDDLDSLVRQTEAKKQKQMGPKKGRDTWGIVERSSWTGGEYGFEADSEQEERARHERTFEAYKDRPQRGGRGRGRGGGRGYDRDSSVGRGRGRGDFGDRRNERNARDDRRPVRQFRDRDDRDDEWASFSSSKEDDASADKEDDFFDSLMSELSDDLDGSSQSGPSTRSHDGSRHHDNAGPNPRGRDRSSGSGGGGSEDSFFENLMSELGGALDEPASSEKGQRKVDADDDFFSSLEAELSQSLDTNYGSGGDKDSSEASTDDDDFFASLQKEMGKALDDSPENSDEALDDDFFSSLIDEVADELVSAPAKGGDDASESEDDDDDFFASLLDDFEAEEEPTSSKQHTSPSPSPEPTHVDYTSLTVPALKDILRSKGLKVGGKKAELIERLQSQS